MVKRIGMSSVVTNQALYHLLRGLFLACRTGATHQPIVCLSRSLSFVFAGSLSLPYPYLCNSAVPRRVFKRSLYFQSKTVSAFFPPHCFPDLFMNTLFDHTACLAIRRIAQGGLSWEAKTKAPALSALLIPPIT